MWSWSTTVPAAALSQELSRQLAALTPQDLSLNKHLDAATAAAADLLSVFYYCCLEKEEELVVKGGISSSSVDVKGLKKLQQQVEETKGVDVQLSKKERREMQPLVVDYVAVKRVSGGHGLVRDGKCALGGRRFIKA